jgi:hypothetical protein
MTMNWATQQTLSSHFGGALESPFGGLAITGAAVVSTLMRAFPTATGPGHARCRNGETLAGARIPEPASVADGYVADG